MSEKRQVVKSSLALYLSLCSANLGKMYSGCNTVSPPLKLCISLREGKVVLKGKAAKFWNELFPVSLSRVYCPEEEQCDIRWSVSQTAQTCSEHMFPAGWHRPRRRIKPSDAFFVQLFLVAVFRARFDAVAMRALWLLMNSV